MKSKKIIEKILAVCLFFCLCLCQFQIPGLAGEASEAFQASGIVWIAGDSTASDHSGSESDYVEPVLGWGQVIGEHFGERITVKNRALSGRSSKSFTTENNYTDIVSHMGKGDYLLVQFGHNDTKGGDRYTNPYGDTTEEGSFKWYIKNYYIEPALSVGAVPVLMSSVIKCQFNDRFVRIDQNHRPFAEAMKELYEECQEQGLPVLFIDMYQIAETLYNSVGKTEAFTYHGIFANGEEDSTHFSTKGANLMAEIVVKNLYCLRQDLNRLMDQPAFAGGDGTQDNPYQIEHEAQLVNMFLSPYNSSDTYFILTQDLYPTIQNLNFEKSFYGHLDGNGKTLYSMIGMTKQSVIDKNYGSVKNCILNFNLQGNSFVAQTAFIYENYGTIDGVASTGILQINHSSMLPSELFFGGIAAKNLKEEAYQGIIKGCSSDAIIWFETVFNQIYSGGICGWNESRIEDCTYNGNLWTTIFQSGLSDSFIIFSGGITGVNTVEGSVSGCAATGTAKGGFDGMWNRTAVAYGSSIGKQFDSENQQPEYEECINLGDLDKDLQVTPSDALILLKHLLDKERLNQVQLQGADMDADGAITILDVYKILYIVINENEV